MTDYRRLRVALLGAGADVNAVNARIVYLISLQHAQNNFMEALTNSLSSWMSHTSPYRK